MRSPLVALAVGLVTVCWNQQCGAHAQNQPSSAPTPISGRLINARLLCRHTTNGGPTNA